MRPEFEESDPDENLEEEERGSQSLLLAYAQLLRLPNVFSAIADVTAGFLIVEGNLDRWQSYLPLLLTSISLYMAGMVLNDLFDAPLDAEERPERPIPSGRISPGAAAILGWGLWIAGIIFAGLAVGAGWSAAEMPWRAGLIGGVLAANIVFYDAWAKSTPIGPIAMGLCRTLNWLLGMSLASHLPLEVEQIFLGFGADHLLVAGGMGLYIAGVTWLARDEADEPNVLHLIGATIVMLGGLALAGSHVLWPSRETWLSRLEGNPLLVWTVAFVALAVPVVRRSAAAIMSGTPEAVRDAVRQALLSVIIFDAAITFAQVGPQWAILVVALLAPAWALGRFVNAT